MDETPEVVLSKLKKPGVREYNSETEFNSVLNNNNTCRTCLNTKSRFVRFFIDVPREPLKSRSQIGKKYMQVKIMFGNDTCALVTIIEYVCVCVCADNLLAC